MAAAGVAAATSKAEPPTNEAKPRHRFLIALPFCEVLPRSCRVKAERFLKRPEECFSLYIVDGQSTGGRRVVNQESVALAMQARQRLESMRAEAQLLALLTAVHEKGWTAFLLEPHTADELADFAGLPAARVQDVLTALRENGIVDQEDGKIRLTA